MTKLLSTILAIFLVGTANAQTPQLVKNINTNTFATASAAVEESVTIGNTTYFVAINNFDGFRNLWKTDGTIEGTKQISAYISIYGIKNCNGVLYFMGGTSAIGFEPHIFNTTTQKVQLLKDILPGNDGSNPGNFTVGTGNTVFFTAGDREFNKTDIWKTDGTPAGTIKITAFDADGRNYNTPSSLCFLNNTLYFAAGFTSTTGAELWKTDGTLAGTQLVKDIYPGVSSAEVKQITAFNGKIYFNAINVDTVGYELWHSDGTEAGTQLLKDLKTTNRFFTGTSSDPKNFCKVGNVLFFTALDTPYANRVLWKTDGTVVGTIQLTSSVLPIRLTNINDTILYFANGNQLYKSNGTPEGTVLIKAMGSGLVNGPSGITPTQTSTTYFIGNNGTNGDHEIWKTDGTQSGTVRVVDTWPGTNSSLPIALTMLNNKLLFAANDGKNGKLLWSTEGTTASTKALNLTTFSKDANINTIKAVKNKLVFTANDSINGQEPWISDGTTAGTTLLKNISDKATNSSPSWFTVLNNSMYFNADDGFANKLWKTDGTIAGTTSLTSAFNGDNATHIVTMGNMLYFNAAGSDKDTLRGYEIWKSDGTTAGTKQIKDIAPKSNESNPRYLAAATNLVYFTANDNIHGEELWKTDGTAAGTAMVKDINTNSFSYIDTIIVMNNIAYFSSVGNDGYTNLWRSNGTAAETSIVQAVAPIKTSYVVIGNLLYFFTYNYLGYYTLWTSDGTTNGTKPIRNFINRTENVNLYTVPVAFKNRYYFSVTDTTNGCELWVSDGTTAGTHLFKNINNGVQDANPRNLYATANKLFFAASTDTTGNEVWVTDGTPEGTKQLADVAEKYDSSDPRNFTLIGENLYFSARTPATGEELWSMYTGCVFADFTANKYASCIGDTIKLTSVVDDFGNGPVSYMWDFAPAMQVGGTIEAPHIIYNTAEIHTIKLSLLNNQGCSSSVVSKTVTMVTKPSASITVNDNEQCKIGNNFMFTAITNGQNALSYAWNFGNGQTATGATTSHTYANAGTYNPTLIITAGMACSSDTATQQLIVLSSPATPVIMGVSSTFKGATDSFSVIENEGGKYKWTISNGTFLSSDTTDEVLIKWSATGNQGLVNVIETDSNACQSEKATKVLSLRTPTTGITALGTGTISIYPNPSISNGALFLSAEGTTPDDYTLTIINTLGQVVHIEKINISNANYNQPINTNLAAGIYTVQLLNKQAKGTQQKLIVW